ncbi:MAG: succinate dehydrogenase, hydrophobic membrane anchor protein [Pseudomonadota bacterium]
MSIKTPTKSVRGLGSAKSGVGHFWHQRVTAIALVPLVVWFVASLVAMAGADYAQVRDYFAHPLVAVLTILLLLTGFYHMRLGVQVIIEDYIHAEGTKLALLLLTTFSAVALGLASVFSVLKISLGA